MNNNYFIIKNELLLCVNGLNFVKDLNDFVLVRNFGSNMYPEIYLDIKGDNEWIIKNKYIEDYCSLIDFIFKSEDLVICLKGFSRVKVSQIVRSVDKIKGTNTKISRVKKRKKVSCGQDYFN